MLRVIDQIGRSFTVQQLAFILLVILCCICFIAPSRLFIENSNTPQNYASLVDPTYPREECPEIPPNYSQVWSWCHGSRYKVCKANYPYQEKVEDLQLIITSLSKIFTRHRISWWLDFNSLRSAFLNGGLHNWDYQIEIAVIEKRFRQYYPEIMEELHRCDDPNSPLYYKRFSNSDKNLRGKFQTKSEPRFWVEINLYYHDEKDNILKKAGWGNLEKEQTVYYSDIPYDLVYPLGEAVFNDLEVPVPKKTYDVLNIRYENSTWIDIQAPSYYRPDLRWGSEEMKKLKSK